MKNLTGCQSYNQSIQLTWNKGKLQFSKKYSFVLTLNCKIHHKVCDTFASLLHLFHRFFFNLYRSYAQKFVFQLEVIIISITNAFLMQLISIELRLDRTMVRSLPVRSLQSKVRSLHSKVRTTWNEVPYVGSEVTYLMERSNFRVERSNFWLERSNWEQSNHGAI